MKQRHESKRGVGANRAAERGFALPAALFGMITISLLVVVSLGGTMDERRAESAVRSSAAPHYAAEAGLHDELAGWATSGYDTLVVQPGDSVVNAWQTLANGCRYQSMIRRIDDGSGPQLFSLSVLAEGPNGPPTRRMLRPVLSARN